MNIVIAFVLSFLAGISTFIGSLIVLLKKKRTNNFIISSLAFAAATMITISFLELIPESYNLLKVSLNNTFAIIVISLFILIGIGISLFIENITEKRTNNQCNLYKIGIISMIVIILHNIPEGMATFIASTSNIKLGISLTIAIALHNIPEGISISIPLYYSTGNKKKALLYSLISGLSEPLGALIAYFILTPYLNDITLGILFSIISGIMLTISLNEILPTAIRYKKNKLVILFFLLGIFIVLLSKIFL